MSHFITPKEEFNFRPLGYGQVKLEGALEYYDDKCGHIYVPDGFEYDLASYGPVVRSVYDRLGYSMRPATVHDWLYRAKVKDISRRDADRIYRQALQLEGATWYSAWSQWVGLRKVGWAHY